MSDRVLKHLGWCQSDIAISATLLTLHLALQHQFCRAPCNHNLQRKHKPFARDSFRHHTVPSARLTVIDTRLSVCLSPHIDDYRTTPTVTPHHTTVQYELTTIRKLQSTRREDAVIGVHPACTNQMLLREWRRSALRQTHGPAVRTNKTAFRGRHCGVLTFNPD